ncbi:hypothetical protein MMC07_004446 [Pseudocyphellaria aurata]|nr:hypothetical protein [Pseudocyphellaria aurata]
MSSGSDHVNSSRLKPVSPLLEAHKESNENEAVNPELKIHWVAPVTMIAFFVSGVSFAAGHHAYYSSLDGTVVRDNESQQWAIRFGSAFAFLVEVPLVAAVSIAQTQRVWTTLEKKPVSIGGIDSVIAATRDVGSLISWEMWSKAKLASLLALLCWCLPLSALVTPATLTVQAVSRTRNVTQTVPAIDFNNVTKFALLSTSVSDPTTNEAYVDSIGYRYPSPLISLLSIATASTGAIQPMPAPFSNASYSVDFYGPAVQCKTANESAGRSMYNFLSSSPQYCPITDLNSGDEGAYYFGMVPGRNRTTGKVYAVDLGQPSHPTDHSSSQPMAPELWFGRTTTTASGSRSCTGRGGWHNFTCTLYNTSYSAEFSFDGGVQSTRLKNIEYLEPMRWYNGVPTIDSLDGSSYGDAPRYAVMSYQAIWVALNQQLIGTLSSNPEGTRILQTPLIGSKDLDDWAHFNFGGAIPPSVASIAGNRTLDILIEEMAQNITLSLFSVSHLWNPNNTAPTTITVGEMINVYNYRRRNLLISYITAVAFALIGTVVGVFSLIVNERSYSTPISFSAILCTTRNNDLDELVHAKSLGAQPLDKGLACTPLRFGTVGGLWSDRSTNNGQIAFGLSDTVSPIIRRS